MADLYVRTGSGGADPAVDVQDLGLPVATGATWLLLNAADEESPLGANGTFSARELRDSQDLFTAIRNGDLEWSKDGASVELAADYVADYALMQNFTDDDLDLVNGGFRLPRQGGLPPVAEGGLTFDTDEQQLYIGTTNGWEGIEMAAPRIVLIDEVPASKFTYVGEAPPGTATTVSGWRIFRLDESSSGDEELIKLYANDSTAFDQVWDDRVSLSYILS